MPMALEIQKSKPTCYKNSDNFTCIDFMLNPLVPDVHLKATHT